MPDPAFETTEKPFYEISGKKYHVSPNPSPLYSSSSSESSESHRSLHTRCISITSVDGSSKVDWDCSNVCTDNDELNTHSRSSCNSKKSVAAAHEYKVCNDAEEEENRLATTELRFAEDWPGIKKEFQILNHFVDCDTTIVKEGISSESRFLELKEKLAMSGCEDYASGGIGDVSTTGVQMLDVKPTDKANPTPCSQAVRRYAVDDFGQLGVDDFLTKIDLIFQGNNRTALETLNGHPLGKATSPTSPLSRQPSINIFSLNE